MIYYKIPLTFLPYEKEDKWEISEDIHVTLSNGDNILIPKGMRTDLRSTPWYLRWVAPPVNPAMISYLIHDYLYIYDYKRKELGDKKAKEFADNEMLYWQKKVYDNEIGNKLCYYAVKYFGWTVFRKWNEKQIK